MNKYLGSSSPLVKRIRSILRTVRPIYTQGCGVFGSLGHGDDLMDSAIFEKVHLSASPDHDVKIKSVSAGWCHSAAVTDTGKLVIFGRPYDDMTIKTINRLRTFSPTLGRFYGNFSSTYGGPDEVSYGHPQYVDGVDQALSVHCSLGLTACLTEDGKVFTMGQNKWGQCGIDNHSKDHIYAPERVIIEDDIKDMDTGLNHCIAYSKCGSNVYTWGRGSDGQLGAGYFKTRPNPVKLNKFEGSIIGISAGFNHSAVITDCGYLYVWGKGMASVLKKCITSGTAPRIFDNQPTPREVKIPGGRKAVQISSGNNTLVIRCSDESLWVLGLGEVDYRSVCLPIRVQQGVPHKDLCEDQSIDTVKNDNDGYYNINTYDPSRFKKTNKIDDTKDILNSNLDSHFLKNLVTVKEQRSSAKIVEEIGEKISTIDGNNRNGRTLPPVVLPKCAIMKKGYQRAVIICQYDTGLIADIDQITLPENLGNNNSKNGKNCIELDDELNRVKDMDEEISYSKKSGNKNEAVNDPITDSSPGFSSLPRQLSVYEVVIHNGEAFLKEKCVSINNSKTLKNPKIVNFSTGWQHTILDLEN